MEPRRPNLFIVGAPRCGTSGMHAHLASHPQVFMSRVKEPHFFSPHLFLPPRYAAPRIDEVGSYLSLFDEAGGRPYVGEASPSYLYADDAADAISRFSPEPRIIIMVRHPAALMYSLYCLRAMGAFHNRDRPLPPFEDLLEERAAPDTGGEPPASYTPPLGYKDLARLANRVQKYIRVFGRARVHVIVFDDLESATAETHVAVARFLGIDPTARGGSPIANHERMPSRAARSTRLADWLRTPPTAIRSAARALLPQRVRKRVAATLWSLNRGRAPRIDTALRQRIAREFQDETLALGDVIQRDLSHWSKT